MKRLPPRIKSLSLSFLQAVVIFAILSALPIGGANPNRPVQMSSEPLHLLSGKTLTPALLSANRTAVLYVWGDWCHICAYTSPTVSRIAEDDIPVVGIALHSGADKAYPYLYVRKTS